MQEQQHDGSQAIVANGAHDVFVNSKDDTSGSSSSDGIDHGAQVSSQYAKTNDAIKRVPLEPFREGFEGQEKIKISPRQYQLELFERAKSGNVIACLDTGSGKTYISVMLMEHVNTEELKRCALLPGTSSRPAVAIATKRRRSLFIVNMVPLVHQQARVIDTQSYLRAARLFGDSAMGLDLLKAEAWEYLLRTGPYDVIVATAQVILDALNRAFITMDDINLIVIDEAHHAIGSNSYARIMESHYHTCPAEKQPRIFAMTASPLNCKGSYAEAAHALQTILDAKIFTASKGLRKEIEQWSSRPVTSVIEYDEPLVPFGDSSTTKRMLEACETTHPSAMKFINRIRLHDTEHGPLVAELAWLGSEKEFASRTDRKIELLKEEARKRNAPEYLSDEYLARLREYGEDAEIVQDNIYNRCRKHASEAAASAAIQSVLRNGPAVPDTVTVDHSNATPKVVALIQVLEAIGSQSAVRDSFCGIIFVQTRRTAIALAELLKRIESLRSWLKPEWLTGHAEQSLDGLDWARQQDIIRRFGKPGDLNVIVATNVVEEGLDVPPCNFVIRFDLFKTHVSYIQSKGRARHAASRFMIFAGRDNEEHKAILMAVTKTDLDIDRWLQRLPEDQQALPLLADDESEGQICGQKRKHDADSELVLRSATTDASIRPLDSVALLYYYVSTLHSESPLPLQPEFFIEKKGLLGDDSADVGPVHYRQTVHLPANAKVRKVVGGWRTSKRNARQHAAFLCCQQLHDAGELDERLLPRKKARIVVPAKPKRSAGRGTAAELQAFHAIEARTPSAFAALPNEADVCQGLRLYATTIKLGDHIPHASDIVLLTRQPLASLPAVTLFTPEVVIIPPTTSSIETIMSEEEVRKASRYTYFVFCLMARLRSSTEMTHEQNDTIDQTTLALDSLPFYLVPLKRVVDGRDEDDATVDWSEVDRCADELFVEGKVLFDKLGDETSSWRKYTLLDRQTFLHNWPMRLVHCHTLLHPASKMQQGGTQSYLDEAQPKYRHVSLTDTLDLCQPILEADRLPPRYNYQRSLGSGAPLFRKSDLQKEWLIPQLCFALPIHSSVAASASILPSVLSRYEQILLARDLNADILRSCMVEERHLIEALAFPSTALPESYEILEYAGDAVLKLLTSVFVFCSKSTLDEGELTDAAADILCNRHLTEIALRFGVAGYATVKTFNRRSWRPIGARKMTVNVSRKGLADLVEAILGAAWRSGGLDAACHCAKHLNLFDSSLELAEVVQSYLDEQLTAAQTLDWQARGDAGGVLRLQEILQYTFRHPHLALEACTHVSQLASELASYQRLEFLGDAVLDMLVVETLLGTHPDLTEGQYTMKKSNAVCNASLSIACVQLGLYKFLRHGDPVIARAIAAFQLEVEHAQDELAKDERSMDNSLPLSTSFDGPKMLADIVEALVGAIYVDTDFDYDATRAVYNFVLRPHILRYI